MSFAIRAVFNGVFDVILKYFSYSVIGLAKTLATILTKQIQK